MLPLVEAFKQRNTKLQIDEALLKINSRVKVPETWREAADMLSPNYYRNVLYKREKHAYVDAFEGVQRVVLQLKLQLYTDRDSITVSKKPYTTLHEGWIFYSMPWSASVIYLRLRGLFQSGIVAMWQLWKFRIDTWINTITTARQEINEFKPLSTSDSNLVVVFYLHAIILGFSFVVLVVEARLKIAKICGLLIACTKDNVRTLIKKCGRFNCNKYMQIRKYANTKDSGLL